MARILGRGTRPGELVCGPIHLQFLDVHLMNSEAKSYLSDSAFGGLGRSLFSLVAQTVKNLPAMQETWVQSLGWKDPLEKGISQISRKWNHREM